jgi:hypothetical protein
MTSSSFYEEGSKLLTPGAFEFVLDNELKRAVRSQNYLTLVAVEASREWEGMMVTADEGTMQQVAQLIGREVPIPISRATSRGDPRDRAARLDFNTPRASSIASSRESNYNLPRFDSGWCRLLPNPRGRRRFVEAPGDVRPIVNWRGAARRPSTTEEHPDAHQHLPSPDSHGGDGSRSLSVRHWPGPTRCGRAPRTRNSSLKRLSPKSTGWALATSSASRFTRIPSCHRQRRSAPTAKSRCRFSAISRRAAARRSSSATRSPGS